MGIYLCSDHVDDVNMYYESYMGLVANAISVHIGEQVILLERLMRESDIAR